MQDTTKVTVRQTLIKYYNEQQDAVESVTVASKLNTTQCKQYLSNANLGIFISKEDIKESFNVNTVELLLLKEDQ